MSKKTAFVEFVLDQLSEVTGVRAQAMFARAVFQRAGMKPFKPYAGQSMTMGYYEVPLAVLENPPDLAVWAKRAVAVAASGKPKRPANRSRRPARHKASK